MSYSELKEKTKALITANLTELTGYSDYLCMHPEISGKEYESSKKAVTLLEKHGFTVEYPFAGMDTAFKAIHGNQNHKNKVALLAEYDALPGIGHACGHSISGAMSMLAAISLVQCQDELDADIHVIGTPAEETVGTKCEMADRGIFDDYEMAMMVHIDNQSVPVVNMLAMDSYIYTFKGKPAHAAAAPWEGKNAFNGVQLMFHGIDMLRQHVKPDVRMHGIIVNPGDAPNIVPEECSAEIYIRALDRRYLDKVKVMVDDCAKGAAIATQTTYSKEITASPFDNMLRVKTGIDSLYEVFDELNIEVTGDPNQVWGSSDVGNVSFKCPSFQPLLKIANPPIAVHTREMAAIVSAEEGHKAVEKGASIIALQVIKIFSDLEKLKQIRKEFEGITKCTI
ncbi:MAG: M20 family metallopeptidase [Peptostreptococcaceae bacterium]|nr:M20 family metallopeptidase [Peptostreptococcaceae bacterium]